MAFQPGYKAYIGLDNAAGSVQNLSSYFDDISFPFSVAQLDVSTFGSSVKRFIPGLQGGDTVTLAGPYDVTTHAQLGSMLAAQAAGTAGFSLLYGPGGSVSGQAKVSCEVYVASVTPRNGVTGRAEYAVSLQIDGAVAIATW